ncbi:hypothetical protein [Klebsiella grimontii]|uniref:hypothetical protein n=1 Tax=Klebsiella grimontii TaxID=2058152 RepID=UPI0021148D1C|nr:hypothetical protein [Klebsiella grimontii]
MTTDITELAQSHELRNKVNHRLYGALEFQGTSGEHATVTLSIDECKSIIAAMDERLALVEALEKAQTKNALVAGGIEAATKLHERIAELESFRTAYMEWSDKTDWVNTDRRFGVVKPLGKHRADVLKTYIDHLESRAVKLPKRTVGEVMHMSGFSRDYAEGWCSGNDNAIHEMRAAGIKVEGE